VLAQQAQVPKFTPQYLQKRRKRKKEKKNLVKVMGWINSKDKSNPG
jgi:hypothetical protein